MASNQPPAQSRSASPAGRLRHLLARGELVVAPGIFDGISAHLVRLMGFPAGYLTGVAAIQLEDQAFPKRCGHLPGKELVGTDEYLAKLGAALDARTDALIIARTDARAVLGLDAAIERGNAYAAAGADVIFVEAPRTVEEITVIAREITAPKLINVVAGGLTPEVDQAMLGKLGYSIAIYPTTALLAAANAAVTALRGIGGSAAVPPPTARMEDFFRLVGLDEWFAVSERWSTDSR